MSKYEEYYDDFVRSGMSARAFATSRGLSRNGFYLFLRSKRNHEAKGRAVTIIAPEDDSVESFLVRIYKESEVEFKEYNVSTGTYEAARTDHTVESAVNRRDRASRGSSLNACKEKKAKRFIDECIRYIRDDPKIRTIEESIAYVKKRGFKGKTVCTKTLYAYVEKGCIENYTAMMLPRRPNWKKKAKYKEYTPKDCRGKSILERPEEINRRTEFGHWEGDLVVGPRDGRNGAWITLLERVTRFYLMIPIEDRRPATVNEALVRYKDCHPGFEKAFRSVTFDNEIEFSGWKQMEEELGFTTYFGRPYHSCDRGSNENCNSLIRRYVKKGTPVNTIGRYETMHINKAINRKLRKLLGWESAERSFSKALLNEGINDFRDYYRLY